MNPFKAKLAEPGPQIGLWVSLASPYTAELCAGAGFDWLLIDGEHGPNDLRSILAQLQAVAAHGSQAVVRPPVGESWMIKQLLDIGARTLLIPMVETAEQAKALVAAVRYPPNGIRGVGAAIARASGFNRNPAYMAQADAGICLLVQIETGTGLRNLEAIAAVEGVDGLFVGPADLSASMGFPGRADAPEMQATIAEAIARIIASGKAAGILLTEEAAARRAIEAGARFVAVGTDVGLLQGATDALARRFGCSAAPVGGSAGY